MTDLLSHEVIEILAASGLDLPVTTVSQERLLQAFAGDKRLRAQAEEFVTLAEIFTEGNHPVGENAREYLRVRSRLLGIVLGDTSGSQYRPPTGGCRTV